MCKYIIVSEVQVNISYALIRAFLDHRKYHIDKNYKGEQKGIFYLASGRKARSMSGSYMEANLKSTENKRNNDI